MLAYFLLLSISQDTIRFMLYPGNVSKPDNDDVNGRDESAETHYANTPMQYIAIFQG